MTEMDENVDFYFTRIPPAIAPTLTSGEPHHSGYTVVFTFLIMRDVTSRATFGPVFIKRLSAINYR
jgi:hypothetical protein